jgi:ribosomal-protein-serine acetyltransferase
MFKNLHLSDDIIILRAPQSDDALNIYSAVSESMADLHTWMDWATNAYDLSAAHRWLEFTYLAWSHSSAFQFIILEAASGDFLGVCGIDGINEKYRFCNLGYWVRSSRRGQGIASRAARLAAQFAFEHLGIIRTEIVIATGNLASQRVAQKAGAHYEGILANRMVVRTEVYDAVMYSFRPKDFE